MIIAYSSWKSKIQYLKIFEYLHLSFIKLIIYIYTVNVMSYDFKTYKQIVNKIMWLWREEKRREEKRREEKRREEKRREEKDNVTV